MIKLVWYDHIYLT